MKKLKVTAIAAASALLVSLAAPAASAASPDPAATPERSCTTATFLGMTIRICRIPSCPSWGDIMALLQQVCPGQQPSEQPTTQPSALPTAQPTATPTTQPTQRPTVSPSAQPTAQPTESPTARPTVQPTAQPTATPTQKPTQAPTARPTVAPTLQPTSQPTAAPTSGSSISNATAAERQMLSLVNEERTAAGLPALQMDAALLAEARKHSQDMAQNGFFSHTSPSRGSFSQRLKASGIANRGAGENIAKYGSIEKAHAGLMASEGHRANIMNANYNRAGIGIVQVNGVYYITQWFANMG